MPTAEQINHWFKHRDLMPLKVSEEAIRIKEEAAYVLAADICNSERYQLHAPDGFLEVTRVMRELAEAINDNAPESADKSAAIRNVRLAREALNDLLSQVGTGSVVVGPAYEDARRNITEARRNANAAIALEGR